MEKWRMCFLIWCLQTYYRNSIYFLHESIFICVNYHHLLYLIIRICRAVFMMMFFLITIKIFIFCEMSFLFIWFSRSILCVNNINIHEIIIRNRQIWRCENNRLKVLLSIWLLILWNLIKTEIFINLLTQSSEFSEN